MTATASRANGKTDATDLSRDDFPVDSFKDAAPHLRRPFTAQAVKFKVQTTWKDKSGGLIVGYIDARLVTERLNLIVPHLWHDKYSPIDNRHMWCHLTVDEITRQDVGEGEGKGLVSDAFKRAAVKFGIGVSLYAIPKMILSVSDGQLKPYKDTLTMTPKGEKRVRELYAAWLQLNGTEAYGPPLDHGDVDDAQGDAEVEAQPVPIDEPVAPQVELATEEDVVAMELASKDLSIPAIKLALGSCGLGAVTKFPLVPAGKVLKVTQALAEATERKS